MVSTSPVMYPDCGAERKATASATSSGVPHRRIGTMLVIRSTAAGVFHSCLAAPGDANGFRQLVADLLDAPALRAELSGRLREASARWHWGCTARTLLSWYESALVGSQGGANVAGPRG